MVNVFSNWLLRQMLHAPTRACSQADLVFSASSGLALNAPELNVSLFGESRWGAFASPASSWDLNRSLCALAAALPLFEQTLSRPRAQEENPTPAKAPFMKAGPLGFPVKAPMDGYSRPAQE